MEQTGTNPNLFNGPFKGPFSEMQDPFILGGGGDSCLKTKDKIIIWKYLFCILNPLLE